MTIFGIYVILLVIRCGHSLISVTACARYDELRFEGKFVDSYCMNGRRMTYAENIEACYANHMDAFSLATSTKHEQALLKAFKHLLAERTSIWINGKRGTDGQWKTENGRKLTKTDAWIEQSPTDKEASLCLSITAQNGSVFVQGADCNHMFWGLCLTSDEIIQKTFDHYGKFKLKEEVAEKGSSPITIGLVGQKLAFADAQATCQKNNMSMMLVNVNKTNLLHRIRDQLGVNERFWAGRLKESNQCPAWVVGGNRSFVAVNMPCSDKLWTYCETPSLMPQYDRCYPEKIIEFNVTHTMSICNIPISSYFPEANRMCQRKNMTILSIDSLSMKSELHDYANKHLNSWRFSWIKEIAYSDVNYPEKRAIFNELVFERKHHENFTCLRHNYEFGFQTAPCSDLLGWVYCQQLRMRAVKNDSMRFELCSSQRDIKGSSGDYFKSACEIDIPLSYLNATITCRERRMELLVIDSLNTQSWLFELAQNQNSTSIWINGEREGFGPWYSHSPEKAPPFPGLSWSSKRTPAKCLSIAREEETFSVVAENCLKRRKFYCEYQRT